MAQNWWLPFVGTLKANQALKVQLGESMEALRTCFRGSSAPASIVDGMLWEDTGSSPAMLRIRNSGAWVAVGPLAAAWSQQLTGPSWTGSLSATKTDEVGTAPRACTVLRLVMTAKVASTSSSGNEWQFQLQKRPFSAPTSPVQLFSGTVGTFTALGGVGGGAEFVAHKAYVLTPNQNLTLADLDRLELIATKLGTATTLTDFHARVEVV